MAYPDHMSPIEAKITDVILKRALARDYVVSVHDGEEFAIKLSTDIDAIRKEVAATDETRLVFRKSDRTFVGSIWLIHGNEEDVVGDCSDNPEINALLDKMPEFRCF